MAKKKSKKKVREGLVVPKEIGYAVILAILAGGWGAYQQLQRIDLTLQMLQEEVKVLTEY